MRVRGTFLFRYSIQMLTIKSDYSDNHGLGRKVWISAGGICGTRCRCVSAMQGAKER